MSDYGIYNNSTDFYNSLGIGDAVSIIVNGETKNGIVIHTQCLGVRSLIIRCLDSITGISSQYACFPRNSAILQNNSSN